ncbi:MAG: phosphatase PAP2 family protein [Caldilineaceae bacterium]|nr:phosphatase PAP2 family protein [Caldilineaceae bacterium]
MTASLLSAPMHNLRKIWPALRAWLPALLLVIAASAIFIDLAGDVWLREGFAWDVPLILAIHAYSAPWLDAVMIAITQLGMYGAGLAALGVSLWMWRRHDRMHVWALWASFGGAVVINTALKILFARPRPTIFPPLMVEHSYSFPSGHTIAATALYGFLTLLLWHNRQRFYAVLVALTIPLVALSRVYLGVHYPSDVLGALAVGIVWLALVWVIHLRFHPKLGEAKPR